jgi:hypothetical protein
VSDFDGGQNWLFGRQIVAACPGLNDMFHKIIATAFQPKA